MKKTVSLALTLTLLLMTACGGTPTSSPQSPASSESVSCIGLVPSESAPGDHPPDMGATILIAAAASLEYSLRDRLIPMFGEKHPNLPVEGTYDSSGKLQTQIEEGLAADLFFSAAQKQMNTLNEKGLMDSDTVRPLLENKIVLIVPAGSDTGISSFEELGKAGEIALGDPESVPVGQYAKEALTSLGLWEELQPKVSFGTNATEVLNWVAEGSAQAGIVYATDAATTDKVTVVAEAPEGSLATKVIYPIGILADSPQRGAAALFLEFLQSDEAMAVFEEYGFAPAGR